MTEFVHLSVHSEYSLVDSVVRVKPLVEKARELGMSALALTDLGNVSAMVKFYRATIEQGLKPILGADLWIADSRNDSDPTRLTLLCANRLGFRNLSRLLTDSHLKGYAHGRAVVLKEWLHRDALEGLLALSGAQHGELGRALASHQPARAGDVLDAWSTRMPGRFYIEVQRLGRAGENEYLQRVVELAAARSVPLVATN
ncbi:MAG TPA: PHP domain-containing protein, partial [Gammaproteobacteria bacterium]